MKRVVFPVTRAGYDPATYGLKERTQNASFGENGGPRPPMVSSCVAWCRGKVARTTLAVVTLMSPIACANEGRAEGRRPQTPEGIERFVDEQQGVVCYYTVSYAAKFAAISCLPLTPPLEGGDIQQSLTDEVSRGG